MAAVRKANKYVADQQPWALAKDPANAARLGTVLRSVVEALRVASVLLEPVLPAKARELRAQLGLDDAPATLDDARRWDGATAGAPTRPGDPLFPRIDLDALAAAIAAPAEAPLAHKDEVAIDDFAKLEFRVAHVQHVEPHPKADKLLVLTVKVGPETRTIVSGIKQHYTPEQLVGKKVVIVANLKPVKLRGVESQGMILAAEDAEGRLAVTTLDRDLADGSEVR
jgi:methionyl-tRNA synthetase